MGHGVLHEKVLVQRLNTKSLTEAELVGVSEYLTYNLWLIIFLQVQIYGIMNNILYQDNQIVIRIDKNGRNYCTGNSRRINIRYFFIKDTVDKGEVKIECCLTQMTLAYNFTKMLMRKVFKIFREVIMGYKPISSLK